MNSDIVPKETEEKQSRQDVVDDHVDDTQFVEEDNDNLSQQLSENLHISANEGDPDLTLLCDLGYGIPNEARPRKEKILAISKQLVNFLVWQQTQLTDQQTAAPVVIVSIPNATVQTLLQHRMQELWKSKQKQQQSLSNICPHLLPSNLSFSPYSLEEWVARNRHCRRGHDDDDYDDCQIPEETAPGLLSTEYAPQNNDDTDVVYLSPDAEKTLKPDRPPPRVVVVGLLIDRKTILTDKSRNRAIALDMAAARWPLEHIVTVDGNDDTDNHNTTPASIKNEPLNVDCVLEGMQQWAWNVNSASPSPGADAIYQALKHHTQRHPGRPLHMQDSKR